MSFCGWFIPGGCPRIEIFSQIEALFSNNNDQKIKENGYNLDIKNPNIDEADLGDPDELLAEYTTLLVDVAKTREALKRELMDVLGGTNE